MFVGREKELKALDALWDDTTFQMAVLYGRRRVGKSELIKQFCSGKNTVGYTAVENSSAYNLAALFDVVASKASQLGLSVKAPNGFADVLDLLVEVAKTQKIVFYIDEYPYLAKAEKSFSSLLQKYIDTQFKHQNMMLILCGSSMSFMEHQVLGYQSPLYGRRTAQFKIEPFDYRDAAKFVQGYGVEDQLLAYGIFGGTPYYLAQIDSSKSLKDNVKRLFFTPSGILMEEPSNLLKQELREPQFYNSMITAIANGSTKLSEIASKTQKATNLVDSYLKKLVSLGIIKKEKPYGEDMSKRSIYVLSDNMFLFWYRFVQDSLSLIAQGQADVAVNRAWKKLSDYMGRVFEDICIQYLWANYASLPLCPNDIGRWWGNNPMQKRQEEIDIVAMSDDAALFGECKYRNEPMDIGVRNALEAKSFIYPNSPSKKIYYLFSKSGFTDALHAKQMDEPNLVLIDAQKLYS